MLVSFEPLDPPATDGAHYFTLEELRAEQDVPETYPDSAVIPNQELAEQVIEHACGAAFIPRRRTEITEADARGLVHLAKPFGRQVEQVTDEYGNVWGPTELEDVLIANGVLIGIRWAPRQPLTVTYTHGYDAAPARVRRAAMIATKVWTERGPVDDRATQIAADGATINLATPGLQGSVTGIPEVDATLRQYDRRTLIA
jgi:hypothetical protein